MSITYRLSLCIAIPCGSPITWFVKVSRKPPVSEKIEILPDLLATYKKPVFSSIATPLGSQIPPTSTKSFISSYLGTMCTSITSPTLEVTSFKCLESQRKIIRLSGCGFQISSVFVRDLLGFLIEFH
ncbi:hypothetical protein LOD99_9079 [Oopsacas minuta]|uniref:Uncharacterized protein n=1 Tax=Oopsacas minuta TaxID=111878 RepID=A0AAV7JDN2_9METZ|nr:hypothetical protein LOD99_9079 [Oopsacas minuta]